MLLNMRSVVSLYLIYVVTGQPVDPSLAIDEQITSTERFSNLAVNEQTTSTERFSNEFHLHPSAVLVTPANFTTNNPLDNLKDFSTWYPVDVHDFYIDSENDIAGNEFGLIDQLAVESVEHNIETVVPFNVETQEANVDHTEVTNHTTNLSLDNSELESNSPDGVSTNTSISDEAVKKGVNISQAEVTTRVNFSKYEETTKVYKIKEDFGESSTEGSTYYPTDMTNTTEVFLENVGEHTYDVSEQSSKSDISIEHRNSSKPKTDNIEFEQINFSDSHEFILADVSIENDHFDIDGSNDYTLTINYSNEDSNVEKYSNVVLDNQLYEIVTSSPNSSLVEENSTLQPNEDVEIESPSENSFQTNYETLQRNLQIKYRKKNASHLDLSSENWEELIKPHSVEHPLLTLMHIEPHAMQLLVKPKVFQPGAMVRLMYERVPRNRPPLMQHLDDPVIEYIPVQRPAQQHYLYDLPMGKYIVCGESQMDGKIVESNCFETIIDKHDNNMLQSGVVVVVAAAIIIVFLASVYSIYHKIVSKSKSKPKQSP